MARFTQVGVQAVVQDIDKFVRDMGKVDKSVQSTGKSLDKDLNKQADASSKSLDSFADVALGASRILSTVAAGAVGVGVAMKQAFDLGREGAVLLQTAESFDLLIDSVGAAPDLLDQLSLAARGTISEMDLMSSTSTLLAGAQGDLATSLANSTPQLLEIARAASKLNPSLGDTTFLYQSLATGIKRASPLILDNLGLTIRIGEANEAFAASLGKAVSELTAEEQKMALLQATLKAGGVLIEQVGGNTDSATDSFDRLTVATEEITNEMKRNLVPVLSEAAEALATILTAHRKIEDALADHADEVANTSDSYEDYVDELLRAAVAGGKLNRVNIEVAAEQIKLGDETLFVAHAMEEANIMSRDAFNTMRNGVPTLDALDEKMAILGRSARDEAAAGIRDLDQELKNLNDLMSIQVTSSLTQVQGKLTDLRAEETLLEAQIAELEGSWKANTAVGQEELEKLRGKLGETQSKIAEVTAEWDLQTKKMIFDLAQQRLAIDGLTAEELAALTRLAGPEGFGLVDQAAVDLLGEVDRLASGMDQAGDQSGEFVDELIPLVDELSAAASEGGSAANAIDRIRSKTVTIRINYEEHGIARGGTRPGQFAQASGGPLNHPVALVGERGPELIINGVVIPAPTTRRLMSLGLGGRPMANGGVLAPPMMGGGGGRSTSVDLSFGDTNIFDRMDEAVFFARVERVMQQVLAGA